MATPERLGAGDAARPARSTPHLASLIRRSPVLDPLARRHWLAVLPHLEPDDRERLRQILSEADSKPEAGSSATTVGDVGLSVEALDLLPGRGGRA